MSQNMLHNILAIKHNSSGGNLMPTNALHIPINLCIIIKQTKFLISPLHLIRRFPFKIEQMEPATPSEARRTLGVNLVPDGSGAAQLKHTLLKAKTFKGKFQHSSISPRAK